MTTPETSDVPWAEGLEHPGDWGLVVRLVTLDVTRAVREHLSIEVPDYDAMVEVLRNAVRDEPPSEDAGPPSSLGTIALTRLEQQLGPDHAHALHRWGSTVFHNAYRNRRFYDFWIILLGQCRWDPSMWAALQLPASHSEVLKNRFLNSQENSRFLADYHRATEGQLSEWDLKMQLDDAFGDDGDDPSTPEVMLGSVAATVRNRGFWRWVVQTFTAAQLEQLHDNAKALVQSREQLSFIEKLTDPIALADQSTAPDPEAS